MREIKFRVWDKRNKRFIEGGEIIFRLYIGDENYEVVINELGYDNGENRQSDFIITQYTGLKDKNGVKIFEGDIVEIEYTNGAKEISYVEFEQEFCRFALKVNSYDYEELTPETDCLEVIGNIYEHPHLLEQTNDNP